MTSESSSSAPLGATITTQTTNDTAMSSNNNSSSFLQRRRMASPLISNAQVKNETVAFLGEFTGTLLFLFTAFAALQTAQDRAAAEPINASAKPGIATLLYVATAFGYALGVNCWLFFRVSGGMFNPAVGILFFPVFFHPS